MPQHEVGNDAEAHVLIKKTMLQPEALQKGSRGLDAMFHQKVKLWEPVS